VALRAHESGMTAEIGRRLADSMPDAEISGSAA